MKTAIHTTDETGRVKSRGTSDLKKTQAYPVAFGAAHGLRFHEWFAATGQRTLMGPMLAFEPSAVPVDDLSCFEDIDTREHEWHSKISLEHAVCLGASRSGASSSVASSSAV